METVQPVHKEKKDATCAPVYSQSAHKQVDFAKIIENRCVCVSPEASVLDAYKVLRTQIQRRMMEQGWKTIMVTSVGAHEGKTITAINLAITFAKALHQTMLLVDCDLKRQAVCEYLCYESDRGIADHLMFDTPLPELIVWPGIEKLTIISGGEKIEDSTEHLGSPKMRHLVEEMKHRYEDRYILFDVPALLECADPIAFSALVDCILVVVEYGRTSMADIKRAVDLVPREKLLGFTVNRSQ